MGLRETHRLIQLFELGRAAQLVGHGHALQLTMLVQEEPVRRFAHVAALAGHQRQTEQPERISACV